MSNYNTQLQSNNTDLQQVLQALQNKAAGGEQATPEIEVNSSGLITATAGTKSSTYQLAFQPAKTITPNTTSQIAVSSSYYTGGNIIVTGDPNLIAGNIKSGVSIFGVNGTLATSGGSGESSEWSENEDAIVSGTITSYTNNRVEKICSYAFYGNKNLTSINFPVCTTIDACAFDNCYNLTTVSFPACTTISSYAFYACRNLTSINFPVCTTINGSNVFATCYNLTTVSFPVCSIIPSFIFWNCSKLNTIYFPTCVSIGSYAFDTCRNLTSVNFPVCTTIEKNAFLYCQVLSDFTLGASSICTLTDSNVFSGTPYAGYDVAFKSTPRIYVPVSLVDAYKSATNWVYFSSYIYGIGAKVIITFTIDDDVQYQAEEGMTWAEWVNSDYNVDGWIIDGTTVVNTDGAMLWESSTDVIINGEEYETISW